MNIYKQIFKQIKKYNTIVIARHIGADPDALGSQFALKEIILELFPEKKVYAVGNPASRFKFFGNNEKIDNLNTSKALCIVLDTPDIKRIDGANINNFEYVIKFDHHPIIDKYANIEVIDDEACSTCQLILEFAFTNKIKLSKSVGEKLYLGIVGDTDRFLHDYTSKKTFMLVDRLLEETDIDFTSLYGKLYQRPLAEIRFEGYIYQNLTLTDNGVARTFLLSSIFCRKLPRFPVFDRVAFVQWLVTLRYSCRYYPLRYSFSLKILRKGKGIIKLGAAFVTATMVNSLAEFLIRSFLCQAGDLRTVGLFNAAITLSIGYTGVVFTSLESDYFPRLSAIAGKKEEWTMCVNRQREVNVLLVGPMLVLFIFVLPMMVPLLYSSDFVDMTRMAQLAAVGVFFKASYAPMEYLPLAKGEPKVYFWQESLAVLMLFFSEVIGFLLGGLTGLGAGILVANGLELLAVSCFCRYYYGYHSSEKSVKYGVGQVLLLLMTLFLVFCSDDSRMLPVFAFVVLLVSGLLSYRSIVKNL